MTYTPMVRNPATFACPPDPGELDLNADHVARSLLVFLAQLLLRSVLTGHVHGWQKEFMRSHGGAESGWGCPPGCRGSAWPWTPPYESDSMDESA